MLTNSRDIKRRLERERWILDLGVALRFQASTTGPTIVPHPRKDLGQGLVRNIYKQAGWKPD